MTDVWFCYDDYRDLDVDEAPCVEPPDDGDWSELAALVRDNEDDVGTLVIERGDDDHIEIVDSLYATVMNLCLGAIPGLVAREPVVVRQFLDYGFIRMDPESADQLLSGDHIDDARFPRSELIPALVDAGRSYLAFLEHCRPEGDEFASRAVQIREVLAEAEAALATWDGG